MIMQCGKELRRCLINIADGNIRWLNLVVKQSSPAGSWGSVIVESDDLETRSFVS